MRILRALAISWLGMALALPGLADTLKVGSKRFTESYLLAEIVRQTAQAAGEASTEHRQGLGNTAILLAALQSGSIDLYPEYSGTIAREILHLDHVPPLAELNRQLAALGLRASVPLGFNNSYALAIDAGLAQSRGITKLSDLKSQTGLRYGLSQEFMGRADGWPGLKQAYGLPAAALRGLDHGLAYEAVAQHQVDVIDVYTTDAKITRNAVRVLLDDANYFPRYDALLLHKTDLPARLPKTWAALSALQGRIDEAAMQQMNAAAELSLQAFAEVAQRFLGQGGVAVGAGTQNFMARLVDAEAGRLLLEHLALVLVSLAFSVVIGIPLGIVAARHPRLGEVILAITGVLQTIPSLALLAMLIPLTGRIGLVPALIALSLYALLPIVRNTHTGFRQVAPGMRQAAQALGLSSSQTLRLIELPLARATILAGIKTSAVISVGTATIAAFIGAGGFGERIVTGLALNDHLTLLAGAIPVALLALVVDAGLSQCERLATPKALRGKI